MAFSPNRQKLKVTVALTNNKESTQPSARKQVELPTESRSSKQPAIGPADWISVTTTGIPPSKILRSICPNTRVH